MFYLLPLLKGLRGGSEGVSPDRLYIPTAALKNLVKPLLQTFSKLIFPFLQSWRIF